MNTRRQVNDGIDVLKGTVALGGFGGIGDEPGFDAGAELGFSPHKSADVVSGGEQIAC
jgi:hypothetical protein